MASAIFFSAFADSPLVSADTISTDSSESEEVVREDEESDCSCDLLLFDGFMGGVGVGVNSLNYKTNVENFFEANISNSKRVNNFNGIIWLSYGKTFGSFYVGLVGSGTFGSSKTVVSTYAYTDLQKKLRWQI